MGRVWEPTASQGPRTSAQKDYLDSSPFITSSTSMNAFAVTIFACLLGCAGNGHIIWLLGFRVKKNPFTTYLLNLAVADLGTAAFLSMFLVLQIVRPPYEFLEDSLYDVFLAMNIVGLCFVTTLGIEKCLAVLFPGWYQGHRPKSLSAKLSFVIWTLSGMFSGMWISFYLVYGTFLHPVFWIMFIADWILSSLVAICTVVLLIKLACSHRQQLPGSPDTAIILMLLIFLIFGILCMVASSMQYSEYSAFAFAFSLPYVSVNSTIKPILYYLLGKPWRCHSEEPLTVRLQRIFQDEGNSTDGPEWMNVNVTADETCSI